MSAHQTVENISQYLTFKLGKESFAIEILRVREVLDYSEPTRVPRSPEFLEGVINLRGNVVPVVDMIIIEIAVFEETILVGALADSVQEVVEIQDSTIDPPPKIGTKLRTEFLKGIGKVNAGFVMILNMDRVLSIEELDVVERLSTEANSPVDPNLLATAEEKPSAQTTL